MVIKHSPLNKIKIDNAYSSYRQINSLVRKWPYLCINDNKTIILHFADMIVDFF